MITGKYRTKLLAKYSTGTVSVSDSFLLNSVCKKNCNKDLKSLWKHNGTGQFLSTYVLVPIFWIQTLTYP
jgi:hypothetical protein